MAERIGEPTLLGDLILKLMKDMNLDASILAKNANGEFEELLTKIDAAVGDNLVPPKPKEPTEK